MTYLKEYNASDPKVLKVLNEHFSVKFKTETHGAASAKVHQYQSSFHTVKEREIFTQLVEEGRILPEAIEGAGLPESLGEAIDDITHLSLTAPTGIQVKTNKEGTPTSSTEQGQSRKGREEGNKITEAIGKFISGYGIRALEVIGGGLLVLFGLFVIAKGEVPRASVSV